MYNINSGYVGSSMSVRAYSAREYGYKPRSDWSKSAITVAVKDCYGLDVSKMSRNFIFAHFVEYKEWHHVGKYFQKVDFYGLKDLDDGDLEGIIKEWEAQKALPKEAKPKANIVFGVATWTEWVGRYKRWKRPETVSYFGYVKNGIFRSFFNFGDYKRVFSFEEKDLLEAKRYYRSKRGSLKGFKAYVDSL